MWKVYAALIFCLGLAACFVDDDMLADPRVDNLDQLFGRYDQFLTGHKVASERILIEPTGKFHKAANSDARYPIVQIIGRTNMRSGEISNFSLTLAVSNLRNGYSLAHVISYERDGDFPLFDTTHPFLVYRLAKGDLTVWTPPVDSPAALTRGLGEKPAGGYSAQTVLGLLATDPDPLLKDFAQRWYKPEQSSATANAPDPAKAACRASVSQRLTFCTSGMGSCELTGGCGSEVSCRPSRSSYKCRSHIELSEKWGGFHCDTKTGYFHEDKESVIAKSCR